MAFEELCDVEVFTNEDLNRITDQVDQNTDKKIDFREFQDLILTLNLS
jgi:hypothetical protein